MVTSNHRLKDFKPGTIVWLRMAAIIGFVVGLSYLLANIHVSLGFLYFVYIFLFVMPIKMLLMWLQINYVLADLLSMFFFPLLLWIVINFIVLRNKKKSYWWLTTGLLVIAGILVLLLIIIIVSVVFGYMEHTKVGLNGFP